MGLCFYGQVRKPITTKTQKRKKRKNAKPQNSKTTPCDWWLVIPAAMIFTASDAKPIKNFNSVCRWYIIPQRIASFCLIIDWSIGCWGIHRSVVVDAAPHQTLDFWLPKYRSHNGLCMTKKFPVGARMDGVSVILFIDTSRFTFWLKSFYLLTRVILFID